MRDTMVKVSVKKTLYMMGGLYDTVWKLSIELCCNMGISDLSFSFCDAEKLMIGP